MIEAVLKGKDPARDDPLPESSFSFLFWEKKIPENAH